jgi:hypothetical protein
MKFYIFRHPHNLKQYSDPIPETNRGALRVLRRGGWVEVDVIDDTPAPEPEQKPEPKKPAPRKRRPRKKPEAKPEATQEQGDES